MMKSIAIALFAASSATAYAGAPTQSAAATVSVPPTSSDAATVSVARTPSSRAHAQPYIAINAVFASEQSGHRGVAVEAALPVRGGAFYIHGLIAAANSKGDTLYTEHDPAMGDHFVYADDMFEEARVGFEIRGSDKSRRLFGGIDIGFQADQRTHRPIEARDHRQGMTEHLGALVTVPRIGVEVGSRVRARVALELPLSEHFDGNGPSAAAGLSLGLGYAF